ncbi:MAG: YciI family protein [Proteobacteria bacterium]|nr:YciI family protein [Pseudomonadota bacterium]
MKFLIVAHDGKGKKAAALRQAVRPVHLNGVQSLIKKQQLEVGGALLDADGKMIGSMMVVDFRNRRALDAYLKREPYVTEGVWKKITVTAMNRVV